MRNLHSYENFYVITNAVKDEKLILTEKIRAYIEKKAETADIR